VLSIGPVVGQATRDFAIEDLFPDDYYLTAVTEVDAKQLALTGTTEQNLVGDDMLCKRVDRALGEPQKFNKGSVAKVLRHRLSR